MSFSNRLAAARRAQEGMRYRPDVLAFHANLEPELSRLQQENTKGPDPFL